MIASRIARLLHHGDWDVSASLDQLPSHGVHSGSRDLDATGQHTRSSIAIQVRRIAGGDSERRADRLDSKTTTDRQCTDYRHLIAGSCSRKIGKNPEFLAKIVDAAASDRQVFAAVDDFEPLIQQEFEVTDNRCGRRASGIRDRAGESPWAGWRRGHSCRATVARRGERRPRSRPSRRRRADLANPGPDLLGLLAIDQHGHSVQPIRRRRAVRRRRAAAATPRPGPARPGRGAAAVARSPAARNRSAPRPAP